MLYSGKDRIRPALMTDLYQLTMAAGYYLNHLETEVTFELFVRSLPENRSYFIAAGLEQAVEFLCHLRFDEEDVSFLRSLPQFRHVADSFFDYLLDLRFQGDVWAIPEGTPFFPNEPILQVRAPLPQAQLVETFLLSVVHFQSLVATKASRIVQAAEGRGVIDFGTRRAHGPEAGVLAARASFVGGCIGTSNVHAARIFGIPPYGTAAHAWILAFDSEAEAFDRYHAIFPDSTVLLIDTYDTIQGARNAVRIGKALRGVRLDSGDLLALSRAVREILDEAGLHATRILASGDLNEYRIRDLVKAGAPIDLFGVGTEMVTSKDQPALSAVYKLVERRDRDRVVYCAKFSEDKATYPGRKQVWRFVEADGTYQRDEICTEEEDPGGGAFPMLVPIVVGGNLLYSFPELEKVRRRTLEEVSRLPPSCRSLDRASTYPVTLSERLRHRFERMRRKASGRTRREPNGSGC